ncbi:hypothetical protein Tco_0480638 [Tanacetum coccineum]
MEVLSSHYLALSQFQIRVPFQTLTLYPSSRPHESAPDLFTSTNVEDETMGGSLHTLPPRSIQAPPAGTTSGGDEDLDKLTALSSLVSTLMQKVNTQESEFKAHKLLFKEVVGKLEEDAEEDVDPLIKLAKAAATAAAASAVPPGKSPCWKKTLHQRKNLGKKRNMLGEEAASNKKRILLTQHFRDKRNKLCLCKTEAYMRTFVKNQSSTIYTTRWTMKHVKSFSDVQLKTEFDKIRAAIAELKSLNIKRSLKRPVPYEQASSKKSKPTELHILSQQTASSLKKEVPMKKRLGERCFISHSTIPIKDGDPKAEHKLCIKYASDADSASDDDTSVNMHVVVDWELLPTGLGWVNVIYRKDNSRNSYGDRTCKLDVKETKLNCNVLQAEAGVMWTLSASCAQECG